MLSSILIRPALLILLCFFSFHNLAGSKALNKQTKLNDLVNILQSYLTFQSDFSQKVSQDKRPPQVSTGSIMLKKPGQFIWQLKQPFPQKLISDGKQTWQYDEDLAQVVISSINHDKSNFNLIHIIEKPSSIKDHFKLMQASQKNSNMQQFTLTSIKQGSPIKEVTLVFKQNRLLQVDYVNAMNQQVEIDFLSPKLNKKISSNKFKFIPPKGVEIINETPLLH